MPEETVLTDRKAAELRQKLRSLDGEFKHWKDHSEENQPFARHRSQIHTVLMQLQGLRDLTVEQLDSFNDNPAASEDGLSGTAVNVQEMIIAIHRIWEFFREKFIQRNEKFFLKYLRAADELAWACYRPARDSAFPDPTDPSCKEPPLVFLNGGLSPFAVPRGTKFMPEDVPGVPLSGPTLESILDRLPISIIGIPWYQTQHLPDTLVIAHEVGHAIEDDFKLTHRMRELLGEALSENTPVDRRTAWNAWLSETFADLYGCLAVGPAFVSSLIDFLVAGKETRPISPDWGKYPPRYLRLQLCLVALRQTGFTDHAQRLEQMWLETYPHVPETDGFEQDIEHIVKSLISGQFTELANKSLKEVISFTGQQQDTAETTVGKLRDGEVLHSTDFRTLFAAVRIAYEANPSHFSVSPKNDALSWAERLLQYMNSIMQNTVRTDEKNLDDEQQLKRDKQQRLQGESLFKEVASLISKS